MTESYERPDWQEAAQALQAHINHLSTDTERWNEAFPVTKVYADKSTYERLIIHPEIGVAIVELLECQEDWEAHLDHLANLILGSGRE